MRALELTRIRWPRVRGEVYSWLREIAAGLGILAFIVSAFYFVGAV